MNTHWQILVVDDEEVMCESLAAWLREDGYTVDTAASGREAIQVGANLAAVIKDMEREMREAATNLEFEKAARLRDEVKRLREMELDTLEGAKD